MTFCDKASVSPYHLLSTFFTGVSTFAFFMKNTAKTANKSKEVMKLIVITISTAVIFTIKLKTHNKRILPIRLTVDLNETNDEIFSIDTILLN